MITLQERKVVRVEKPKAGFYAIHFDDGGSKLVARLTRKLGVLDKAALKFWAANIERDYVEAHRWLTLSRSEAPEHRERLRQVEAKMSAEELAASRQLIEEWRRQRADRTRGDDGSKS